MQIVQYHALVLSDTAKDKNPPSIITPESTQKRNAKPLKSLSLGALVYSRDISSSSTSLLIFTDSIAYKNELVK